MDIPVEELLGLSPQGELARLGEMSPISGREAATMIHRYGSCKDIHIIHSPYCYYESHILFNKYLEIHWRILYNTKEATLRGNLNIGGPNGRN